jgi:predicted SAM-dependent methyltransferase
MHRPAWGGARWKPLASRLVARVNQPIATYRLARYLEAHPPPYRLQVGAGLVNRDGWLNTDIGPRARYWLDIGKAFPFPNHSVTQIFSEHVIEHVDLPVVENFLREAVRVLVPGGAIRILTPDAETHAREYLARSARAQALVDRSARLGWHSRHPVDILNLTFHAHGHRYIWDEESLRDALLAAGFSAVQRHHIGHSPDAELATMDGHFAPDDPAIDFTLVLEATTPLAS